MTYELDLPRIVRLLGVIDMVALQPGDFLFQEGDVADGLFIVRRGLVQVISRGVSYETVTTGGIVGELAIVDEGVRSAAVLATTHAELIKVDIPGFLALVEHEPEFALTVMHVMAHRLRTMNGRRADAA